MTASLGFVVAVTLLVVWHHATGCLSIGCFVCTSMDGNEPLCEDPFNAVNPNSSTDFYQADCMAGRKHRQGLFPSSVCIKIKGRYLHSEETLMIRTCSLDSSSQTMDTELSRVPHSCGVFDFVAQAKEDHGQEVAHRVVGCIDVCDEVDGCNAAAETHLSVLLLMGALVSARLMS